MDNELITSVNGAEAAQEQETKTYTQEEVLALLQSETDKRVLPIPVYRADARMDN